MSSEDFSDFKGIWKTVKPTIIKIYDNFFCLFENKHNNTKFLSRAEYIDVYRLIKF